MIFPPPTEKQAKVLWFALTSLAGVLVLGLLLLVLWALGWLVARLSFVLLPLALAGILACLLDPAVQYLEQKLRLSRKWAIVRVLFLVCSLAFLLLATVVPTLFFEGLEFATHLPQYLQTLGEQWSRLAGPSPADHPLRPQWDDQYGPLIQAWLSQELPQLGAWALSQLALVANWFWLLVGMALVPLYAFFFLSEKRYFSRWADYLPMREGRAKKELIFLVDHFNETLITFFRGQVLVALCTGTLLAIGYTALGLDYAVSLGAMAAVLGIIPFLGALTSAILAVIVAVLQFHDWLHPAMLVGLFLIIQTFEAVYTAPKIIGNRVGMHPVGTIIAILLGTAVLGGFTGGVLAIPFAAALRTVMSRYFWVKRGVVPLVTPLATTPEPQPAPARLEAL